MITLSPGSLCDVCAEEYGPRNYPHCIPCGHILCLSCCNNILQKTSPRLKPACPFCRESFASDTVRLIRIDFSNIRSGYSTPRLETRDIVVESDDDMVAPNKTQAEAKRLERKVAKVAAKKCSVEEVSTLHRELQDWLVKSADQTSSLSLSAALLRAILVNHLAHSEATKIAKNVETQLRDRLEEAEMTKSKLEAEVRSLRTHFSQTAQDSQSLRAEFNRYKVKSTAPVLGMPTAPAPKALSSLQSNLGTMSPPRPQSAAAVPATPSRSRATSPTSPTPYSPSVHSPLAARMSSTTGHMRSASVQPQSGSLLRSTTPSVRSGTHARSGSPPPAIPSKLRTMSISNTTPPKMIRATSSGSSSDESQSKKDRETDERQREKDAKRVQLIQRWIPNLESTSPPTGRYGYIYPGSAAVNTPSLSPGRTRTVSAASAAVSHVVPPFRYKTPLSANSP